MLSVDWSREFATSPLRKRYFGMRMSAQHLIQAQRREDVAGVREGVLVRFLVPFLQAA